MAGKWEGRVDSAVVAIKVCVPYVSHINPAVVIVQIG